jgi:hypothetical protein
MGDFIRRLAVILSTGYICLFFSELAFWSQYDPKGMAPRELLATWLAYSMVAYVFLSVLALSRGRSIWALFLAGAVYGWLVEGVAVQTMYDDFPINLSWTGLAWHALITIVVGWYLVRKILLDNNYLKTVGVSGVIGIIWGGWAIYWWIEHNAVTPLWQFALYALAATLVLILSYAFYDLVCPPAFRPTWIELGFLALITITYFLLVSLRAKPIAGFILPPLLALVYFALKRNRHTETRSDVFAAMQGRVKPLNYLGLLFIPLAAIAVYSLAQFLNLRLHTNLPYFYVSTVLGAAMLVLSITKIFIRVLRVEQIKPSTSLATVFHSSHT